MPASRRLAAALVGTAAGLGLLLPGNGTALEAAVTVPQQQVGAGVLWEHPLWQGVFPPAARGIVKFVGQFAYPSCSAAPCESRMAAPLRSPFP